MRIRRSGGLAAALAAAVLIVPAPGRAAPGDVRRVSAASGGVSAQGASTNAAISADRITGSLIAETMNACASCPGPDVAWSDRPHVPPGFYQVRATAIDLVGNSSPVASMDLFIL